MKRATYTTHAEGRQPSGVRPVTGPSGRAGGRGHVGDYGFNSDQMGGFGRAGSQAPSPLTIFMIFVVATNPS
jgi:hypothetical protein